MIRISLGELEEAVANPKAFSAKIAARNLEELHYSPSYFAQLVNSIYKFHDCNNNTAKGEENLTIKHANPKLTNDSRKKETIDQYHWYVTDFNANNTQFFGRRYILTIQHFQGINVDFELNGVINRLDIKTTGGYAAWLFLQDNPYSWKNELRMPLIQDGLSQKLNAFTNEIYVGIYSFKDKIKNQYCYSDQEIADAKIKFDNFVVAYLQL